MAPTRSHLGKAQVSIELLLVALLFTAFALLAANYVNTLSENSSASAARVQSRLAAAQAATLANAVCVSKANASFVFNCPRSGFVYLGGSGKTFFNASAGREQWAFASAACAINNSLALACAHSRGERVCFEYSAGVVKMKAGECT